MDESQNITSGDEWEHELPLADPEDLLAPIEAPLDHVAFAPPVQLSLSSVLNIHTDNVTGLRHQPGGVVLELPSAQWEKDSLDPWNLLRRALHEHHPLLYVRRLPRRRCRQKNQQDLGDLVRKLHKDARYISWRISHDQLSAARDEFVRRYTEASCQPWSSVVRVAKRLFNAQCREYKNAWTVVCQLA